MFSRILSISLIDMLFLLLAVFILQINPPKKEDNAPALELALYVEWDDGRNTDLDTYVRLPSGKIVWYQAKDRGDEGVFLTKDDLGSKGDRGDTNREITEFRSPPDGVYWISIHNYADTDLKPGKVTVKIRSSEVGLIRSETYDIPALKQEIGVWQVTIVDGKVSDIGKSSLRIRKDAFVP